MRMTCKKSSLQVRPRPARTGRSWSPRFSSVCVPYQVTSSSTAHSGVAGHARAILERIQPGGHLIGIDADPIELARTEEGLRAAQFGADVFTIHNMNFRRSAEGTCRRRRTQANVIMADLGVSIDATGRSAARFQLQGARAARHADEPGAW
jgi:hypothetical protein